MTITRLNLRQITTRLSPAQEAALRALIEHGSYAAATRALGYHGTKTAHTMVNGNCGAAAAFGVTSAYSAAYLLGCRDGFHAAEQLKQAAGRDETAA